MTVSLLEILAAARAHAAPLAAESAGYLLLAVADHAAVAPRAVSAEEIELLADGSVRLRARRGGPETGSVERSVRRLLARTLEVAGSVGPSLRRVAERSDEAGLETLVRELEKALIPVNRSAARRALSRLHRETERARDLGKLERFLEPAAGLDGEPATHVAPPEPMPSASLSPALPEEDWSQLVTEPPEPSPVSLPMVVAAPAAGSPQPRPVAPMPELTLTPEPRIAVGEPVLTKPEPVVLRNRERGGSTPRFGTIVTAQTMTGEEGERTEPAPSVALDDPEADADELAIEVEVELETPAHLQLAIADEAAETPTPLRAATLALTPQPLVDPEPSTMPDVLLAMVTLHAGVDADEAPTRLRDIVTAVLPTPLPAPAAVESAPALAVVEEFAAVVESERAPAVVASELEPALVVVASELEPALAVVESEPEPRVVRVEPYVLFQSELAEPELHEALTWDPGPVVPFDVSPPAALLIAEPEPELSPLAPAVLPARQSDVSELVDSFYVSDGAEEHELRSALKEMAGLELTPLPHPLVSGR